MANGEPVFNMVSVSSSQLAAVGYNKDSQKLRVRFNNGSLYEYSDVPEGVDQEIISAASPGGAFNATVKNVYSFERLS